MAGLPIPSQVVWKTIRFLTYKTVEGKYVCSHCCSCSQWRFLVCIRMRVLAFHRVCLFVSSCVNALRSCILVQPGLSRLELTKEVRFSFASVFGTSIVNCHTADLNPCQLHRKPWCEAALRSPPHHHDNCNSIKSTRTDIYPFSEYGASLCATEVYQGRVRIYIIVCSRR